MRILLLYNSCSDEGIQQVMGTCNGMLGSIDAGFKPSSSNCWSSSRARGHNARHSSSSDMISSLAAAAGNLIGSVDRSSANGSSNRPKVGEVH